MAWSYKSSHGLSSNPTAVVVVDTTDTTFDVNGTPKDLIGGADMTVNAGVTVETGGAWGTGFETKASGTFGFLGLTWATGPACGMAAATNGGTIVFFVNEFLGSGGAKILAGLTSNDDIRLNSSDIPAMHLNSGDRFTATTAWVADGTAFAHALAFHGNNSAKALYGLQSASDLSADGSATPGVFGDDVTLVSVGGVSGFGHARSNYYAIIVFDEIVSDADLQAIFDNPLIFVDQGVGGGAGQPFPPSLHRRLTTTVVRTR